MKALLKEEGKKENEKKQKYEKPFLNKEKVMNFPVEIINSAGRRIVCRQCSSCHGCQ